RPGPTGRPAAPAAPTMRGPEYDQGEAPMISRARRIALWGVFALATLVASGLLLADHLTPPNTGRPSHALPVHPDHTPLDRELAPLLARHPGMTGALTLVDG